jgi:hypothetical protein
VFKSEALRSETTILRYIGGVGRGERKEERRGKIPCDSSAIFCA